MTSATGSSSDPPASIVVVEDEDDIREVLTWNLSRAGYRVTGARDGISGLEAIQTEDPALVILDLMLPGMDGMEVCRRMRSDVATVDVPVIMLTARSGEQDIVSGLGVGADDYVTKPFRPTELLARVEAVLRRGARPQGGSIVSDGRGVPAESGSRVTVGEVSVDPDRHEVLVDGVKVRLTRTELRLLHALMSRPGRVLTREQLVSRAIGEDAWVTERTIDVHIRAVRRKLGGHASIIETIRGVGYRCVDEG